MLHSVLITRTPLLRFSHGSASPFNRFRVSRATETEKQTAREAVDAGLAALEKQSDPQKAVELFEKALRMNPTDKEACAAAYNIACCYVEMQQWQKAADQLVVAVNDYRLDLQIPRKAKLNSG